MRKYEAVVVFDPNLSEGDVKEESKKVQTLLETHKAHNVQSNFWGKKEIAYLVGKHRWGNFVAFNFQSESPETVSSVSNILRITDNVLKFQTHRINERARKFKGNPKKLANAQRAAEEQQESAEAEY